MLFLRSLSVLLTTIWTVSGVRDQQCDVRCTCCIDEACGTGIHGWKNVCSKGCIDGHRGARCYEHCQFENCKSCGGNSNKITCTDCYDGYYLGPNKDCTLQCPSNCKSCVSDTYCTECKENFYNENESATCNCRINCECSTGQSDCVSCKKGFYNTSTSCNKQCLQNCLTCESEDLCNKCKPGFYGAYENDNNITFQLGNCSFSCRDTCTRCLSYDKCLECKRGKYGNACQEKCSVGCKNGVCLPETGHCECVANFTGDKCLDCINGTYGVYCNQTCSKYCKNKICEKTTGTCIDGCSSINMTGNNCSTCIKGMYDELCNTECPENCKHSMCERNSGNCREGCIRNFNGTVCDLCIHGKYGENCEINCPSNCEDGICEKGLGTCYNCLEHFQGETCEECSFGFYGSNCEKKCSNYCNASLCDRNSGKCFYGCTNGYSGDRCCVKSDYCDECSNDTECRKCESGFFNSSCNEKCPDGCLGSCAISTGECDDCRTNRFGKYCEFNCSYSYFGAKCQTDEQPNLAGPIAGGVVALILVIVAGILVSIFFLRRRRIQKDYLNGSIASDNWLTERIGDRVEAHVYENIMGRKTFKADPEGRVLDKSKDVDGESIKVADLSSYVTKDRFDFLKKEFTNLPKPGNLSLCKIAREQENVGSNRYNRIYPFDHSRVTIPADPKFYINACYIDGYNRRNAYIASSGPTLKHTEKFRTFWRMVWHEKSDIIVMLTNLREASEVKCEQYWPEIETGQCYGPIEVTCRSEEEFAEYTVRRFSISKGKENRNLTQLHFTAWQDKGVPSEVTSLVEFRQRVKAAPVVLDGPVIVHCSAGVGRTGTYIALDILSKQGQIEHSINVFKCVSKMRQQRVVMVQTAEQYIFIYKALVHTLTFGCEPETAEEIQNLSFDDNDTFVKIFRTLRREVDFEREEDIAAREKNKRIYADKSRHHTDIPGNRGRVRLYLQRKSGIHIYIDAVFINSFKSKNLFIAAQTPLPNTVEDFLCLVYQQNHSCVVALEDPLQLSKKHDIGIYLPADNESNRFGEFIVTSSNSKNKPYYTIKKLTIKHTDQGEDRISYHFQYRSTKWENGRKVPDSPGDFVQFIKDIETYIMQRKEDMPNIIVHCLNGNERSGLFCVVYILLEKLEAERQVSVVNVVRKVRAQRKLSISSVKQLKFCYQCISAYSESYNTYSNFAV